MKKILVLILIILLRSVSIFAQDIDVGSAAINRPLSTTNGARTYINRNNPANDSGTITEVKIYVHTALTNVYIGTFYVESGNYFTTRDYEYIGSLSLGLHTKTVDINIESGDYIGISFDEGRIDKDNTGGNGYLQLTSNKIIVSNTEFTLYSGQIISLYGTGTAITGLPITFNGATISKWNTAEISKWNGVE